MGSVFLGSVFLKGIGAILEILLQMLITRKIGLAGYGTYTMWVSCANMVFWVLFSGIVKCNTFYLSGDKGDTYSFRRNYYLKYVLPLSVVITLGLYFTKTDLPMILVLITLAELVMLDMSSILLAQGKSLQSLVGEYILGRMILLIGVCFLGIGDKVTVYQITVLNFIQYVIVILYFFLINRKKEKKVSDVNVSMGKWLRYQGGDVLDSLVGKMPVILQYFVAGALEAAVISIVILVKKLITFISGPTSKIFLPEFSRLYHENNLSEIRKYYESIIRIQLIFTGPLAVALLGYSNVVLKILAEELLDYTTIFQVCSAVFLFSTTLGPCAGLLQMTDNESRDNYCRIISIAVMFLVFWIFRDSSLFVAYGLCAQNLVEALCKYVLVCKWFKGMPIRLSAFLKWWAIPGICIIITKCLHLQDSIFMLLFMAGGVFLYFVYKEMKQGVLRGFLSKKMHKS